MSKLILFGLLALSARASAQCEHTLAHLSMMARLDANDPRQFFASDLLAGLFKDNGWRAVAKATTADAELRVIPVRLLAVKLTLEDRRKIRLQAVNDFRPALSLTIGNLDDRKLTQIEVTELDSGFVLEVRTTDAHRLPVQMFLRYSAEGRLEHISLHPRFGSQLKMDLAPLTGS